jgi:serine/threonine-protein kinase
MGEVYRAKDSKLKREVALKVLPDSFAADPERTARFQREAEVLATLNHPNIAQIYGVEQYALVMELVDGETLKGPLQYDVTRDGRVFVNSFPSSGSSPLTLLTGWTALVKVR